MKQWRVGTVSMGVALILFGSVLFVSQLRGAEAFETLIDWWPVIFVLLGLELLIYIGLSRMSQPVVKYDIFSILFVGFLCFVCLGAAVFTSTGLMQEVRFAISSVERAEPLPELEQQMPAGVKRVLVQNHNGFEIQVDKSTDPALHVFGTVHYTFYEGDDGLRLPESIVSVKTIGDTMYVTVNRPPHRNGIRNDYPLMDVTVVLPENVQAEITGNHRLL